MSSFKSFIHNITLHHTLIRHGSCLIYVSFKSFIYIHQFNKHYQGTHSSQKRKSSDTDKRHTSSNTSDRSREEGVNKDKKLKHDDEDEPELINWDEHRKYLDSIFFKRSDLITYGSQDYHDFWEFLRKFSEFQQLKKPPAKPSQSQRTPRRKLDLPTTYDDRYKINFSILVDTRTRNPDHRSRDPSLNEKNLMEFRRVLHLFENFSQKKSFGKILKIRGDQSNLPIFKFKDQIVASLEKSNVVVVAGDTGCGKSTQLPQYLLKAGYTRIACTQPRRIATMALCRRVAYETLNEYGAQVAYQIRFDSSKAAETKILFLTEGLLLRQVAGSATLNHYNVIIVDEVHERHIFGDFLLGILRSLVLARPDIKLVLMSATINVKLFSEYFHNAPLVLVPGRMFPVDVQFMPMEEVPISSKKVQQRTNPVPYLRLLERIDAQYPATERGDMLIFMSGINEILTLADELKRYPS